MKYKVSVLDKIPILPEVQDKLKKVAWKNISFPNDVEASEDTLIKRTQNAEAVLVSTWCKITDSYIKSCPTVRYVGLCGTSDTNIDLNALKKNNVMFSKIVDYGDEPAAEYMFMLLLKLARGDGEYQWQKVPRELMGKSIGIIGLGALGKAIAYLALGFKMNVFYYSHRRKKEWEAKGVKYVGKKILLNTCDVIAISTPSDVKVLGNNEFEAMKLNAILMYLSGGEALSENAFRKWISIENNYALFNYSAGERYHNLFKDLPQVIFPKVIAGHTHETKERLGQRVIENLNSYFNNQSQQKFENRPPPETDRYGASNLE